MRDLMDATRFAISTEETRYYLNGIFIHKAESGELCAVATDGHRLALTRQALPSGAAQMPSIILPRKAVNELRKLLDDFDGEVLISLSETRAEFRFDVVRLTSKLIDGTFPDYTRVIPVGNDRIMKVDVSVFSAAVDRVATIASEKSRSVKMELKRCLRCRQVILMRQVRLKSWKLAMMVLRWKLALMRVTLDIADK